jgi:hypothetical protein
VTKRMLSRGSTYVFIGRNCRVKLPINLEQLCTFVKK